MTFWEHLDVLRDSIIRMIVAAVVMGVVAFCLKEPLFDIVLAPKDSDFITYRWLGGEAFSINLINTGLAEQFLIHMKVALMVGILVASPYILFLLFRFIAPALYENERRYSVRITVAAYAMFLLGIVVNYFIIFPLTVRFLGTYQVSETVSNMLTISSYIDTLMMMSLIFGIIFEIPVVSWLLAIFGLLKASWMSQYRRHAVIAILILAAAITPTGDALTLVIVALPIWLLYEVSILIVKMSNGSTNEHNEAQMKN
ncbi:MAG: twin-arginine translocase subunit TatC [Bacteroidaceae bacterium]|nr:twin-arginine translocase subunit TatC [Bacteroidaceae bacterium]